LVGINRQSGIVERTPAVAISEKTRRGMGEGSWIRKMFEMGNSLKQKYGAENVFDLTLGNPIAEPPAEFKAQLKKLADKPLPGMHRYMPNGGYLDTRSAVAGQLAKETGVKLSAADIIMTCGAAGAANITLRTIINAGEEVIIFKPFFAEYINYIDNAGAVVKAVPTDADFLPDYGALEQAITVKTKAVIINSPNNPTGVVYSEATVRKLAQTLEECSSVLGTKIYLISDEPYRNIIFDGLKYPSPLSFYSQSIVVTSYSKDLALPGERIGYVALHPQCDEHDALVDGLTYCNRILGFVNAPALMQHLVRDLQGVTVSIDQYQSKRDFIYETMTRQGFSLVRPQGAFYMFPKAPIADDVAFVNELLEYNLLVVPGSGFGMPGYFRLSYCTDNRTVEGAMKCFGKVAEKYKLGNK